MEPTKINDSRKIELDESLSLQIHLPCCSVSVGIQVSHSEDELLVVQLIKRSHITQNSLFSNNKSVSQ